MTLLPCPFCGSPATIGVKYEHCGLFYYIYCHTCGIETCYEDTASNARDVWNRRTPIFHSPIPPTFNADFDRGVKQICWNPEETKCQNSSK